MKIVDQGLNPIFMDPDPDKAREVFRKKSRAMTDKRTTIKEVVEKFIPDGCSVHPVVEIRQIKEATGFELIMLDYIQPTSPPRRPN